MFLFCRLRLLNLTDIAQFRYGLQFWEQWRWRYHFCKGKFFSEDNMKLVGSPCFANILLLLNIFSVHRDSKMFAKYGDPTSNIISSEKNLPLPISCFLLKFIGLFFDWFFFILAQCAERSRETKRAHSVLSIRYCALLSFSPRMQQNRTFALFFPTVPSSRHCPREGMTPEHNMFYKQRSY